MIFYPNMSQNASCNTYQRKGDAVEFFREEILAGRIPGNRVTKNLNLIDLVPGIAVFPSCSKQGDLEWIDAESLADDPVYADTVHSGENISRPFYNASGRPFLFHYVYRIHDGERGAQTVIDPEEHQRELFAISADGKVPPGLGLARYQSIKVLYGAGKEHLSVSFEFREVEYLLEVADVSGDTHILPAVTIASKRYNGDPRFLEKDRQTARIRDLVDAAESGTVPYVWDCACFFDKIGCRPYEEGVRHDA